MSASHSFRSAPVSATAGSTAPTLLVALLEDDPLDTDLLIRLLTRSWPSAVDVAAFGALADLADGLRSLAPDLVLCDLSLPDGKGIDVVKQVLVMAGSAPVVVLTGNSDPEIPVMALEVGAQDYLHKNSLDGDSLARTVRYAMARRAADRENTRIERSLSQLNRELDRYAGIMAHDLRAPVRTARLFADRLVATACGDEEPPDVAKALDSSLERLESMISRLQSVATLRDAVLQPEPQQLDQIVTDVADQLSDELHVGAVELRCVNDGEILADQTLIRQLLRELVNNSINFRSMNRPLTIEVSVEWSGNGSTVTVADNGIGIEPQYRDRVFRLFERLSSVETAGLGFGLAFCTQVAEMHGGSICAVEPTDSVGTAIQLTLPRQLGHNP